MNEWQLHEAKNKLSDLIEIAMHGKPQCITKRGVAAVMVIGIQEYLDLKQQKMSLCQFLLTSPKFDIEIERVTGKNREVDV